MSSRAIGFYYIIFSYELLGKLPLQNEPNLLSFDETGNLIITYNHGANCTDDNGRITVERKTVIVFTCDRNAIVSYLLQKKGIICRILSNVFFSPECSRGLFVLLFLHIGFSA